MTTKERLAKAEERIAALEAQVEQLQQQMPQPLLYNVTPNATVTTTMPLTINGLPLCPRCGCYYSGVHYCVPNVTAGQY